MKIYEIGGIDNTGKTTQIRMIRKKIGEERVFVPPTLIEYCDLFPQANSDRTEWYQHGDLGDIVRATCIGASMRREDIEKKNKDYALLDRGFLTLYASNIARVMSREKLPFNEARRFVDKIRDSYDFNRIENASAILAFNEQAVENANKRGNGSLSDGFKGYLECFDKALKQITGDYERCHFIDASQTVNKVQEDIIEHMNEMN
jgi:thymidylate kinase